VFGFFARVAGVANIEGKHDVLKRGERRNELEGLKDDSDPSVTKIRELSFSHAHDVPPLMRICLESGVSMPDMRERRVDFPDPEAPIMATRSPAAIERVTFESTRISASPCR
jgi:hypothetical protein